MAWLGYTYKWSTPWSTLYKVQIMAWNTPTNINNARQSSFVHGCKSETSDHLKVQKL